MIWVDLANAQDNNQLPPFRTLSARLKLAPKPSTALRELSGTLSAQVQSLPEPLLTIDKPLQSVGESVSEPDGCSMELRDAALNENGELTVRVSVRVPLPSSNFLPLVRGNRVVRRGGVVISSGSNATPNPALVDEDGERLPVLNVQSKTIPGLDANTFETTITVKSSRLRAESARLVYSGPRTHVIQVPFALKNVPLR
jgi:hypothetical protein